MPLTERCDQKCEARRSKSFKLSDEEGALSYSSVPYRVKAVAAQISIRRVRSSCLRLAAYPEVVTEKSEGMTGMTRATILRRLVRNPGAERKAEKEAEKQKKKQETKNAFKAIALAIYR